MGGYAISEMVSRRCVSAWAWFRFQSNQLWILQWAMWRGNSSVSLTRRISVLLSLHEFSIVVFYSSIINTVWLSIYPVL